MSTITGKNIVGYKLSARGTKSFKAFNPSTATSLPEDFYYATREEIDEILELSAKAFMAYKLKSGKEKAGFLEAIADEILALGDELIQRCVAESGLPVDRITGERGRTIGQLKLFAELLKEGSWLNARIDTAIPDRQPIPKPDLRRIDIPIGSVLVFGASNFPLAFSTAGGDTASALAAGCPVIIKAHPSHPGTNDLISGAILKAAKKTGMPEGVFNMFYAANEETIRVVTHPAIKAVGFTGSRSGGMAIFKAAMERKDPIPVYAEMSAINPVVVLPKAIEERSEALATGLAGSITLGVGQFCTNPGISFLLKSEATDSFLEVLAAKLKAAAPGTMLNQNICKSYKQGVDRLKAVEKVTVIAEAVTPADLDKTQAQPVLFAVEAHEFITNQDLKDEVFGPSALIVLCKDEKELHAALQSLDGQLTATIHAGTGETADLTALVNILTQKAGRVLFGGFPTGVEVSAAQHHGGPFPATSDARTTSVGTAAIDRFVRPVAYQNFPNQMLPEELKNENSLKIMRLVNGDYTKEAV